MALRMVVEIPHEKSGNRSSILPLFFNGHKASVMLEKIHNQESWVKLGVSDG